MTFLRKKYDTTVVDRRHGHVCWRPQQDGARKWLRRIIEHFTRAELQWGRAQMSAEMLKLLPALLDGR